MKLRGITAVVLKGLFRTYSYIVNLRLILVEFFVEEVGELLAQTGV
tara:strand:+ start:10564 stop:10701 length:138 start_codon:yes stop_codon:yes gene_type:complete